MTHNSRGMDRIGTMIVRQELHPRALAELPRWCTFNGARIATREVQRKVPPIVREGVEAVVDGRTVYPWRDLAVTGYDDDGETVLDPMTAADLEAVGYTDDALRAAALSLGVEGVPESYGTDEASQLRRLVFLRFMRAAMG